MTCSQAKVVLIFSKFEPGSTGHLPNFKCLSDSLIDFLKYNWTLNRPFIYLNQIRPESIKQNLTKLLVTKLQKLTNFNKLINRQIYTKMEEQQEQQKCQQFRTVITGYRLHGQLLTNNGNPSIFSLKIQSSANKEERYEIVFDSANLEKYKMLDVFPSATSLYEYLSKMTKIKVKFNNEAKLFVVLYEKDKNLTQFTINLTEITNKFQQCEKKQTQTTFSQQKFQQQEEFTNDLKENTLQQVEEPTAKQQQNLVQDPSEVMKKLQDLRLKFQSSQKKEEQNKPIREMKHISYSFQKKESQTATLYEYAFSSKLQDLMDLIENQQIDKVEQIVLKKKKMTAFPPLNQIPLANLKFLSLEENKINQIQWLDRTPNIEKLNLDGNRLKKIQNLEHLANLKILKLGNNEISKIEGLQALLNLQTLWLDFNSIEKIQGLNSLKNIKSLNLSFNMITKIENLGSQVNLQELLLNQNQISTVQNLDHMSKLTRLSINMNQIQKVRGFKKLLLLEVLYIAQNQIEEFDKSAFEELNWLKMLKQLRLNGNYIQWNQQSRGLVERLRNYGVKVTI